MGVWARDIDCDRECEHVVSGQAAETPCASRSELRQKRPVKG